MTAQGNEGIEPATDQTDVDGAGEQPPAAPDPDATPEATPEAGPEATPEAGAETTPEATPEAGAETTPEATPEAGPETTPEATPEAGPETTPEAGAETTQETTPEATSEAAAPVPAPSAPPAGTPTATPRPTPARPPVPTPAPPRARPTAPPAATTHAWGRVAEDGTVYVREGDGERSVGQYPEGTPVEALAFFVKRYDDLEFEVRMLDQRVRGAKLSPDEATESIKTVAEKLVDAPVVGDLAGLSGRLDALGPVIDVQREKRRADRARRIAGSRDRKTAIVAEAEKLGQGKDWRNGANRLRDLLDEWKALPRLEKAVDDELWHRFSSARTAYTRRRKAHFAELNEKRDGARVVKEGLAKKAEALADSKEWGPTSSEFRALMQDWKAAGPAPKDVDDELWKRFRGAQDVFFGARDAANAAQDEEFAENAEKKKLLLVEAEALVPVTDLDAAKKAFRDISEKWDAAGKVPRDQMKDLEARIRKVEQAIRGLEDDQWRRTDPEKSARADDMVTKLEKAITDAETDLESARATGNAKKIKDLEDNLASRKAFLEMAQKAASEFGG